MMQGFCSGRQFPMQIYAMSRSIARRQCQVLVCTALLKPYSRGTMSHCRAAMKAMDWMVLPRPCEVLSHFQLGFTTKPA